MGFANGWSFNHIQHRIIDSEYARGNKQPAMKCFQKSSPWRMEREWRGKRNAFPVKGCRGFSSTSSGNCDNFNTFHHVALTKRSMSTVQHAHLLTRARGLCGQIPGISDKPCFRRKVVQQIITNFLTSGKCIKRSFGFKWLKIKKKMANKIVIPYLHKERESKEPGKRKPPENNTKVSPPSPWGGR